MKTLMKLKVLFCLPKYNLFCYFKIIVMHNYNISIYLNCNYILFFVFLNVLPRKILKIKSDIVYYLSYNLLKCINAL